VILMFDRTYQPGGSFAPVGMADNEGERVTVWRDGFGWVDRPADWDAPVEVPAGECQGAA